MSTTGLNNALTPNNTIILTKNWNIPNDFFYYSKLLKIIQYSSNKSSRAETWMKNVGTLCTLVSYSQNLLCLNKNTSSVHLVKKCVKWCGFPNN